MDRPNRADVCGARHTRGCCRKRLVDMFMSGLRWVAANARPSGRLRGAVELNCARPSNNGQPMRRGMAAVENTHRYARSPIVAARV